MKSRLLLVVVQALVIVAAGSVGLWVGSGLTRDTECVDQVALSEQLLNQQLDIMREQLHLLANAANTLPPDADVVDYVRRLVLIMESQAQSLETNLLIGNKVDKCEETLAVWNECRKRLMAFAEMESLTSDIDNSERAEVGSERYRLGGRHRQVGSN